MVSKKAESKAPEFKEYAIIQTGGKQYQAIPGKTISVEKLAGEPGDSVEFAEVLLRKNGEDLSIGQPHLEKAVKASIVKHMRGKKLVVFKFKRRQKSRVKSGHRQEQTIVRIDSI
jgi:large subunit ribosomal protein L21